MAMFRLEVCVLPFLLLVLEFFLSSVIPLPSVVGGKKRSAIWIEQAGPGISGSNHTYANQRGDKCNNMLPSKVMYNRRTSFIAGTQKCHSTYIAVDLSLAFQRTGGRHRQCTSKLQPPIG